MFSKTKLIATYGPSLDKFFNLNLETKNLDISNELENSFKEFCDSGVNVIRFNLSHDTIENHHYRFELFRKLSKLTNKNLGILIDTKGPEIRVGKIQNTNLQENIINKDQVVKIHCQNSKFIGNGLEFCISDYSEKYNFSNDVNIGDEILIDDGKLILKVSTIQDNIIEAISLTNTYTITRNKRVNLFNKKYSLPFLSEYDIETIRNAVLWGADFIALSFIGNLKELNEVKKIIHEIDPNSKLKIIYKIESFEATTNLEELVVNSDGIMVARGDLALEIGYENVPYWQDKILELCNKYNKIGIVATQMLDSLENKILPTRAEVTDCYYAVKSLADSTMLSSESASSFDPINSIKVMKNITNKAESSLSIVNDYNFLSSLFQTKEQQKLIKKIMNHSLGNDNILLEGFNENEIRFISSTILNKNFFIISDDFSFNSKLTLYKNLNIISLDELNNFVKITKNGL